ncbi:N-terminal acetyltransferase [Geranomyces variabilis]|uniref:N-terminal acetyltransferase n=1 Tax=Geranomyces variabilis TaxID=109894 RepID=A0AAD5TP88_9FUNG|nr:N-terminal acetyltransferase [Geranomyces variabilis]
MSEPASFTAAQLSAYVARIGLHEANNVASSSLPVTLDTLRRLQAAQLQTVPYENLSLHWRPNDAIRDSIPPCGISPDAVCDKMVASRTRGGYCLELNYLLAYALRAVGFSVDCCTARWLVPMGHGAVESVEENTNTAAADDDAPMVVPDLLSIWPTHVLLVVSAPALSPDRYLVDVGLAKNSLTAPIKLEDAAAGFGIAGKQVRLRKVPGSAGQDNNNASPQAWVVQFRLPGRRKWTDTIHFVDQPADQAAVDQIHQWMSRAPESVTPEVPFATMVCPGIGQVSIAGNILKIRGCDPADPAVADPTRDQPVIEVVDTEAEFERYFGIKGYKNGATLVKVGETAPAW